VAGLPFLDWLALLVYLGGITVLGLWSKREIKSREDFLLGGRRFGKLFMIFHAFGTGTHTDQAAAVVSKSYEGGLSGIWAQWNWMICTPFYWLLAPLFRRTRCLTVAQVYEERYGPSVGVLCVIVSSLGAILAMGTMLLGTARTIQGLLGIDPALDVIHLPFGLRIVEASFTVSLLVMTALFLLYGAAGGIVAAVRTDFVQGLFIILLSGIALPFAFQGLGGMAGVRARAPEGFLSLVGAEFHWLAIFALSLTSLVSIVSQSHIISVTSSGKTEWEGRVGMTYGNFLKRVCTIGWCLLGVLWFLRNPGLRNPDLAFGDAVSRLLGPGFRGLMLASIMAAAMSTCDSMMVAVSGLFTENVYRRFLRPEAEERHYVLVERLVSAVVVIGAIFFAYCVSGIFQGLKEFWKVTATIGIAFWLGILWRRANTAGAWASFLAAAGVMAVAKFVWRWDDIHQMALFLPVGFLTGIIVSLLTPPEDRDEFFVKLYTPIGEEEKLELSLEEAIPPEQRLLDAGGFFLVKPSRQTWGGFLIAWGIVALLVLTAWGLVRL